MVSPWFFHEELDGICSKLQHEVFPILRGSSLPATASSWSRDDGWPGTHRISTFQDARFVVGLTTRARTGWPQAPPFPVARALAGI